MVYLPEIAKLSDSEVKKINQIEKDLGIVLIAFKPMVFADLDDKQIKDLQKVEKEIGATVIAYLSSHSSKK
jgi:hypothetical protein